MIYSSDNNSCTGRRVYLPDLTSIYILLAGRHLIGFLLFLCLTIFTAMVIPRSGSSSRSSTAYQLGDLVEMARANMTVALRHEALAACFLLPPSAAAASAALSEDGQQIPTSCPPNTSSSSHHHAIQIQVLNYCYLFLSLFTSSMYPLSSHNCVSFWLHIHHI